ncbi:FmdB family zinc ribbon protein [Alienimonas sp. DA493]|uniref:FmdB family zinc ribbon protein n=1 Tax=Alienimonas sp. DA493 TaxID=3373605 RepID=UPI003754A22B
MPTYDYKCRGCDHRWDEFQSITAEPTQKCPECGKKKAERVIGAGAGILFKGSGFYQTDYRSEGYKKAADADKKSSAPHAESKSDSKAKSGKSESKSSGSD